MRERKNWYAVYTRSGLERKVNDLLTAKGIATYFPQNKIARQEEAEWGKMIFQPLFSRYVFVYISEQEFEKIKKTKYVISFVHWLDKPAVIDNQDIETIRDFLSRHSNVAVSKTSVGSVVAENANSQALPASALNTLEKHSVAEVDLPSMGYCISAAVMETRVEVSNYKILNSLKYFVSNINYLYRQ